MRTVKLGTTSMTSELAIQRSETAVAEGTLRHVFVRADRSATAPIPQPVRTGLERYSPS